MKVTITSSVSSKLRSHRIEIDDEFCKSYKISEFKEASVDVETSDAYLITPKTAPSMSSGRWVSKDMVEVLPDIKSDLSRWT